MCVLRSILIVIRFDIQNACNEIPLFKLNKLYINIMNPIYITLDEQNITYFYLRQMLIIHIVQNMITFLEVTYKC